MPSRWEHSGLNRCMIGDWIKLGIGLFFGGYTPGGRRSRRNEDDADLLDFLVDNICDVPLCGRLARTHTHSLSLCVSLSPCVCLSLSVSLSHSLCLSLSPSVSLSLTLCVSLSRSLCLSLFLSLSSFFCPLAYPTLPLSPLSLLSPLYPSPSEVDGLFPSSHTCRVLRQPLSTPHSFLLIYLVHRHSGRLAHYYMGTR